VVKISLWPFVVSDHARITFGRVLLKWWVSPLWTCITRALVINSRNSEDSCSASRMRGATTTMVWGSSFSNSRIASWIMLNVLPAPVVARTWPLLCWDIAATIRTWWERSCMSISSVPKYYSSKKPPLREVCGRFLKCLYVLKALSWTIAKVFYSYYWRLSSLIYWSIQDCQRQHWQHILEFYLRLYWKSLHQQLDWGNFFQL